MATIVSAYYKLPKSKHSSEKYREWIGNFLGNVAGNLVFFTSAEEAPWIREARGSLPMFLIEMPFSHFPLQSHDWMEYWQKTMEEQDEFRHLHSPEQFVIWNCKTWLVMLAIEKNPFQSSKFVWCDAGCWRDVEIAKIVGPTWPNAEKIPNTMLFLDIRDISWQRSSVESGIPWYSIDTRNAKENCIGGTIFAGSMEAWSEWSSLYYDTLHFYKSQGLFAGDDQFVMMSTDLRYKENKPVHYLAPQEDGYFYGRGDRWFALQIMLA